jgi:hypothetical protein
MEMKVNRPPIADPVSDSKAALPDSLIPVISHHSNLPASPGYLQQPPWRRHSVACGELSVCTDQQRMTSN